MYRSKRCRLRGSRGLSLLEVLVSMIILAVGILGLAPMVVLSIEGNNISRDFTIATELAKEQLELHEAMGLIVDTVVGYDEADWIPTPAPTTLPDTLGYTRTIAISPEVAGNPPSLVKVIVNVQWTDKMGNPRATKHSTLMTNN